MNRSIPMLSAGVCIVLAIGCGGTGTEAPGTTARSGGGKQPDRSLSFDTTSIDAFLRFTATTLNEPSGGTASGLAHAAFTDDNGMVNVSVASLNSNNLTNTGTGFYLNPDVALPGSGVLTWSATGYSGSNFGASVSMAPTMTVSNLNPGDSVSKSSGFTVSYSGSTGGDLEASLKVDFAYTTVWIGPDSATSGGGTGYVEANGTDNGSVTFSSAALASLAVGRVYVLRLRHDAYNLNLSHPLFKVGIYSDNTTLIPVYLKP